MDVSTDIIVYYMAPIPMCVQEFKDFHRHLDGVLEVIITDNSMTIISIVSKIPGCGTDLMRACIAYAHSRGVVEITVDDCSERYRRDHNIYVKFGMTYNSLDGPEMTGDVSRAMQVAMSIPDTSRTVHTIHI